VLWREAKGDSITGNASFYRQRVAAPDDVLPSMEAA
jgi:hypothetical protein